MSQDNFFGSILVLPGVGVTGSGAVAETALEPVQQSPTRTVNNDWRKWVAENLLRGQPTEALVSAMVREGFDQATALREVQAARSHPYLQAAAAVPVAARGDTGAGATPAAVAKRDWVLEIYRRSARMDPATAEIPVVKRPSREEFLRNFYSTNRPCLIEGAMDDWPAMTGWTMENLKRRFGDRMVEVQAGRNSDANYEMNSIKHKKEMRFGDYVDLVTTSGRTNDFYMTANNSGKNKDALADAWNDIKIFREYLHDDPANNGFFWFGPAGIVTPLHHDLTNNFMAQVTGRKLVRLIAPYELPHMYNHRHCFSRVDLNNVDYDKYPAFRNVRVIDVMLNPGQVLFLPIGWWHHVTGMEISITMTFTNFVFDNDFFSWYTTYGEI